jgi:hypothetical protein
LEWSLIAPVTIALLNLGLRVLAPIGRKTATDVGRFFELSFIVAAHEALVSASIDKLTGHDVLLPGDNVSSVTSVPAGEEALIILHSPGGRDG